MSKTLDAPTTSIQNYIDSRGIKLKTLSKATGIPYNIVRASCNKGGVRPLQAIEYFKICEFLGLDPMKYGA